MQNRIQTTVFANSVDEAQNLLAASIASANSINNFSLAKHGWLKEHLMKAAEAVVLCDEDVAIDHFEQATRGVNGLVVKFLKGSVEFFESKFEQAKVGFQKEIDTLAANYKAWEPVDRSFTDVQNFWNKRISVLKSAPLTHKDDLEGWIALYNKMHESIEYATEEFARLAQSRRARANMAQRKANELKQIEHQQARNRKKIERDATKVIARSNPDIQQDLQETKNRLLAKLRPQAQQSA